MLSCRTCWITGALCRHYPVRIELFCCSYNNLMSGKIVWIHLVLDNILSTDTKGVTSGILCHNAWVWAYVFEDCKGNGFRCSLSLLATGFVFSTSFDSTLVHLVLLWSNNATTQPCWNYSFYINSGCPKFAYVTNPSHLRQDKTCDLQIAPPRTFMLCFFVFLYFRLSTCKVGHFACHFLLSFFLLVLLWKEFIPHSFVVTFHFSRLSSSPPVFYPAGTVARFICQLFCLHIQQGTRCLFEQWTLASSLEAAVCRFCLSISWPMNTLWDYLPLFVKDF